jgi:hypothetical protein
LDVLGWDGRGALADYSFGDDVGGAAGTATVCEDDVFFPFWACCCLLAEDSGLIDRGPTAEETHFLSAKEDEMIRPNFSAFSSLFI